MLRIDIEEVFGAALVDTVRRAAAFFGCLLLASVIASFSLGAGEAVLTLRLWRFLDGFQVWPLLWITPFISAWVFLFVPLLVLAVYHFFTEDELLPRPFLPHLAAQSVLMLMAAPDPDWKRLAALVVLIGCLAAIRHLCLLLTQYRRRLFEEELLALAAENREARQRLREAFGTDIPEPEAPADYEDRSA